MRERTWSEAVVLVIPTAKQRAGGETSAAPADMPCGQPRRPPPQATVCVNAMSEHPVIAGYRGLDSAEAVALGALLARALGEPLVLAGAYRYEPAALSARALTAPDNTRRATRPERAATARDFAGPGIDVRQEVVPSAGTPGALIALARTATPACSCSGATSTGGSRAR